MINALILVISIVVATHPVRTMIRGLSIQPEYFRAADRDLFSSVSLQVSPIHGPFTRPVKMNESRADTCPSLSSSSYARFPAFRQIEPFPYICSDLVP